MAVMSMCIGTQNLATNPAAQLAAGSAAREAADG
jgi:hypothetical protein